jgi:hypothetical protein
MNDREMGVRFSADSDILIFSITSRPALRPTQPPAQWTSTTLSPKIKQPRREADNLSSLTSEVKNAFSCNSIHPFMNGSTALCWALAAFSVSYSYTQSVGLLGRGISPSQDREQQKHRTNAHRNPCPEWDSNARF